MSKRKKSMRCRLGLHRWDCHNAHDCTGDHKCLDCNERPHNTTTKKETAA